MAVVDPDAGLKIASVAAAGVRRYCGGPGAGPWAVARGWARGVGGGTSGAAVPAWAQFAGRGAVATWRARVGIERLCRWWGVGAGDEVLVPSYNCGTEVDPWLYCGARVVGYRVDGRARVDAADVRARVTARTRVVYVTHYFGWAEPAVGELAGWCAGRGLKLVEDCALSLFSAGPAGPVGLAGDAAVFSLCKTLAVPDGGVLTWRAGSGEGPGVQRGRPRAGRTVRRTLPLLKRAALRRAARLGCLGAAEAVAGRLGRDRGAEVREVGGGRPDVPADYYYDGSAGAWGWSAVTRGLVRGVDAGAVVARRRENYARLLERIAGVAGVRPLFEGLPAGVCPLGLPVVVEGRDAWYAAMQRAGVDAYAWWSGYHRGVEWDAFPEACGLKDRVLVLPVHQQLGVEDIEYVGDCVRRHAKGMRV